MQLAPGEKFAMNAGPLYRKMALICKVLRLFWARPEMIC
jgi:hypothetical protein